MRNVLLIGLALCCFVPKQAQAQDTLTFQDLSFWRPLKGKNWQTASNVAADFRKDHHMTAEKGRGVLVNLPDDRNRDNLISINEYGDVNISFEFMMAQHSNSGFYLQGRYEVQLLDSWGRLHPAFNDCGGIFARRRFHPQEELFEGYAPLQNAALAPGLWQKMHITFFAPRFDATGQKIKNARITVQLNGVTVQDNRELTGPTGGPISETEATKGPIMIQGDHGAVAFRNMVIRPLGNTPPVAGPVHYEVIYGNFRQESEFLGKKADLSGVSDLLTWENARKENGFALKNTLTITPIRPGLHTLTLQAGGNSIVRLNGTEVLPQKWTYSSNKRQTTCYLPEGPSQLEVTCFKMDGWMPPILALNLEGPDGSSGSYHAVSSTLSLQPADPIYLDAPTPKCFRSFVDYEHNGLKKRLVHPVNVGHPDQLHYTYNLDNGALTQIWKGDFLDVSPMWDNRGDGSSHPRGALLTLGNYPPLVPADQIADTSEVISGFRSLGYDIENDLPVFRYSSNGIEIHDQLRITEGRYFTRTVTTETTPANTDWRFRVAEGTDIVAIGEGWFAVNDRQYLIGLPKGVSGTIITSGNRKILTAPFSGNLTYSIIY